MEHFRIGDNHRCRLGTVADLTINRITQQGTVALAADDADGFNFVAGQNFFAAPREHEQTRLIALDKN